MDVGLALETLSGVGDKERMSSVLWFLIICLLGPSMVFCCLAGH